MFTNTFKTVFITLISTLMMLSIHANTLNETDPLRRVLQELDATSPLISDAQRVSDHQNRLRVNYSCLIGDINILKHGLRAAVYGVKHKGAYVQSLCGDYGFSGQLGEEARYLHLLINELQSLSPLLQEAQRLADRSQRARLNYSVLQGDIDTIIFALQKTLVGAGDQPRSIPPQRGAYSS